MRALVLLALLPLAACGDSVQIDIDPGRSGAEADAIEEGVQSHFESTYGVEVASVSCDAPVETPSAEVGAVVEVHSCTVEQVEGDAFKADLIVKNDVLPDGEPTQKETLEAPGAIIVALVERTVGSYFFEQIGTSVSTSCPGPRVVLSTPGDTVSCTVSDGTEQRNVLVTITDDDGGIDFSTVD